jgi:hypothetical protein
MTLTGAELLTGFSRFINDYDSSTTTSAGNATKTTLVDTYMSRWGDGHLQGQYIRLTSGTAALEVRRITENTQTTGTITVSPAFSQQVASGVTYELHRYDPVLKFRALDSARLEVIDHVYRQIYDDTITSDGFSNTYDIPTTIEIGPVLAIQESPIAHDVNWNFITNPQGNNTTNWSTSNVTASTYDRAENDTIIPKYDETCTKLVVAANVSASYFQIVGNMSHSITAALAAGRTMTFCAWVYSLVANKIRLEITDDAGDADSAYHGGTGWELLAVEKDIDQDNATTLTVKLDVKNTTGPLTAYWNRAWFYFGHKERLVDSIFRPEKSFDVRRDDTDRKVVLASVPPRGYQVRLVGKSALTELGTQTETQLVNAMEVNKGTADIVYAQAAELLFQWERINTDNLDEVQHRIGMVRDRMPKLVRSHAQETPRLRMRGPFSW